MPFQGIWLSFHHRYRFHCLRNLWATANSRVRRPHHSQRAVDHCRILAHCGSHCAHGLASRRTALRRRSAETARHCNSSHCHRNYNPPLHREWPWQRLVLDLHSRNLWATANSLLCRPRTLRPILITVGSVPTVGALRPLITVIAPSFIVFIITLRFPFLSFIEFLLYRG